MGGLREMSREGLISADIIKNSLFSAADQIEQRYATLPMTFGDIFNQMSSTATMSFSGLLEDINGFANSDFMNNIVNGLPSAFNTIALNLSQTGSYFSEFLSNAKPLINEIATSFSKVGSYVFSANGIMGAFFNTLTKLSKNSGVGMFFNTLSSGAMIAAESLNWIIQTVGNLSNCFGGFVPLLGGAIVGMTTFKGINAALLPIASHVGTAILLMRSHTELFKQSTIDATMAQQGFNAVLAANPYGFAARALTMLASALASVAIGILAVNKAAGIASDSVNIGGYEDEVWEIHEQKGLSLSAAKQYYDEQQVYDTFKTQNKQTIQDTLRYIQEDSNYIRFRQSYGVESNVVYDRYNENNKKLINETNAMIDKTRRHNNRISSILEQDETFKKTQKEMEDFKNSIKDIPDIDIPDFTNLDIGSVGNVGSVDKINDTVDISSEDLRYMRDLAEREVINKFTQTTLVPKFEVHFGDVRETADVQEVIDALKRQLQEELATSANGIHL